MQSPVKFNKGDLVYNKSTKKIGILANYHRTVMPKNCTVQLFWVKLDDSEYLEFWEEDEIDKIPDLFD